MNQNTNLRDLIINPLKIKDLSIEKALLILEKLKFVLENDFLLIEFPSIPSENEIYVIGDLHGNLKSLIDLINIFKNNKPNIVIFLGDLVDRGPHQLECLLIVGILKILEPEKYYILKGNHESEDMNKYYGFYQEFIEKFRNKDQYTQILEIYSLLPYCALINDQILCLHGGIPEDFQVLSKLKGKRVEEFHSFLDPVKKSLLEILWNDPKEGIEGFRESYRGPGIKFFGEDVFKAFMDKNQLRYLIRGHEMFEEGYRWFFHKNLLSIFSSENYRGFYYPNPASYAVIKNNYVLPKLI